MNYKKIYDDFIEDRRQHPTGDLRAELHHILPISAGGTNDVSNIIRLSIRDHVFAHKVLRRLGLSPVATNKMSRAVAAKILAGYSDEIGFGGRGPGKNPAKRINAILSREAGTGLRGLSDMLADRLVEMLSRDPVLSGYRVGFNKSTKFHKFFNREVFPRMKDFVTISKASPATPQPATQPAPGAPPAVPKVRKKYVFMADGDGRPFILRCEPRADMVQNFADTNLRLEIYSRLDRSLKNALDANGGRLSPDGPRICYSDAEYGAMRNLALVGGFARYTKNVPGEYTLAGLQSSVESMLTGLLMQNALVEHIDDVGYREFRIGPDIEDPGQRLLEMQLAVLTGEEYARTYTGILNSVMGDAVQHFASSLHGRKWLYTKASEIAARNPGELKEFLATEAAGKSADGKMLDVPREIHDYLVRKCLRAIREVFCSHPCYKPIT